MIGVIKWFNPDKGFGMITPEKGGDVFLVSEEPFVEGQVVVFKTEMTHSGKLSAYEVRVL